MKRYAWRSLLKKFNRELLNEPDVIRDLPADLVASGWLGFEGASKGEIDALQVRLGIKLPPSYRQFLAISNGWQKLGVLRRGLVPVSQVDWYRTHHQNLIDAWRSGEDCYGEPKQIPDNDYFIYGEKQAGFNMRSSYLPSTLLISNHADDDFLLNPEVVFQDGEWEAWEFSAHIPGARRYRSFIELIEAQLESLIRWRE